MSDILDPKFDLAYCHNCKEFNFFINIHKGNILPEQTSQFEIGKHLAHWKHHECAEAFRKWVGV